jgi:hypothetical protein
MIISLLLSCAGLPVDKSDSGTAVTLQSQPDWVLNLQSMFPSDDWLAARGQGMTRETARNDALNQIALLFRTDINGLTRTQELLQNITIETQSNKNSNVTSALRKSEQDITAGSNISGLIGLQFEEWTARDGSIYVCAYLNKKESAARYKAIINENDGIISSLIEKANAKPASFESYSELQAALKLAEITDNYYSMLIVLDAGEAAGKPQYGSYQAIKTLFDANAKAIVINIDVQDDDGGRIKTAFGNFFTQKGFKTGNTDINTLYIFTVHTEFTNVEYNDNTQYQWLRYTLRAELSDNAKKSLFHHAENGREGHLTKTEVKMRVLNTIEESIHKGNFANEFNLWLSSL